MKPSITYKSKEIVYKKNYFIISRQTRIYFFRTRNWLNFWLFVLSLALVFDYVGLVFALQMRIYMFYRVFATVFICFIVAGCADQRRQQQWGDIDYSKVRNRAVRENDNNYTPPSVTSCVDDDLYNCK